MKFICAMLAVFGLNAAENLTLSELNAQLDDAKHLVAVGSDYFHYRNHDKYHVVGLGIIEATQEVGVIYQKDAFTWIRPLSSWLELVEVDGKLIPRFKKE